jgi:hypothetical protein
MNEGRLSRDFWIHKLEKMFLLVGREKEVPCKAV